MSLTVPPDIRRTYRRTIDPLSNEPGRWTRVIEESKLDWERIAKIDIHNVSRQVIYICENGQPGGSSGAPNIMDYDELSPDTYYAMDWSGKELYMRGSGVNEKGETLSPPEPIPEVVFIIFYYSKDRWNKYILSNPLNKLVWLIGEVLKALGVTKIEAPEIPLAPDMPQIPEMPTMPPKPKFGFIELVKSIAKKGD